MAAPNVLFEGLTQAELLALSDADLDTLVFNNKALVIQVGSAQVLGRFASGDNRLILELAQIDAGGEGVLTAIATLAGRIARRRDLYVLEWIVHAVNCPRPNLKLRRVLDAKGFTIKTLNNAEVYHRLQTLQQP